MGPFTRRALKNHEFLDVLDLTSNAGEED
ncbi:uncharacterized protein G2W53_034380 [Senna tora]|uniref:Uncharacterized protein n=1 Tax=Senna tora TaxID=362788 RepID=A0A834TAX6_9FABA|nr:uncharacterized protein G2W53_034380 [Senna tora]